MEDLKEQWHRFVHIIKS